MVFDDIVLSIPQRFRPEKAKDYETVFHFEIKDNKGWPFTVTISKGTCTLKKGLEGKPACVVKTKSDTYVALETGKENPQMALMFGKVKVSNLSEMIRFSKLFHRYGKQLEATTPLPSYIPSRKPTTGPLKGLKVVDFTRLLPGPMATMLMAEMGAEVIKIEDPSAPDYIRNFPPFIGDHSAYYLAVNRSKRSLAIDYNTESGKEVLYQLIKEADVLMEQFRPGVMQQLGFGYDDVKKLNPKLVYVSITGYGQDSPYAQRAGHDLNYIAYAGLLGITGNEQSPSIPGGQIADIAGGGYMAVNACLAALVERSVSGEGQWVDVSMTDCMVPLSAFAIAEHAAGKSVKRGGQALSGGLANYNVYRCADGAYMALGALEPKFWEGFCDLVDKPEWKHRLLEEDQRELKSEVAQLFAEKTKAAWISLANQADICLSPVHDIADLVNDPHMVQRGLLTEQTTPNGEHYKMAGVPIKFLNTPAAVQWEPPMLGEDTIAILQEMGLQENAIKTLLQERIVLGA
ncbi:MAG: CoA transferase [Chitinophagales bacterium]|nr:CoA transferase [Chitinophagales bacterium]